MGRKVSVGQPISLQSIAMVKKLRAKRTAGVLEVGPDRLVSLHILGTHCFPKTVMHYF